MAEKMHPPVPGPASESGDPSNTAAKRPHGHAGDMRDTVAELAERAQVISQEAGTKVASAMKDVISAAAGIAGFAIESARDLVQFMVRRGQMTPEEGDKLIREAEAAHGKRSPSEKGRPTASKIAAEKAAAAKAEAAARAAAQSAAYVRPTAKPVPPPPLPPAPSSAPAAKAAKAPVPTTAKGSIAKPAKAEKAAKPRKPAKPPKAAKASAVKSPSAAKPPKPAKPPKKK